MNSDVMNNNALLHTLLHIIRTLLVVYSSNVSLLTIFMAIDCMCKMSILHKADFEFCCTCMGLLQ